MDDFSNITNWTSFLEHENPWIEPGYPLEHQIIATVVHIVIFLLGVIGNTVLIVVVFRTRHLQSPTYTYLVSLAFADLIVLVSAVPEAVVVVLVGKRWLIGQVGCSLFIFANFLGINAGSLSILGFTVEQYVAVCGNRAWKHQISEKTTYLVWGLWIFTLVYCSPWLGLTEVQVERRFPEREQCNFRLSREQYLGMFGADFVLFYAIPLVVALVCYTKIASALLKASRFSSWDSPTRGSFADPALSPLALDEKSSVSSLSNPFYATAAKRLHVSIVTSRSQRQVTPQARRQVLRMLVVIVVLFAIAWLPFRGLLIYNSFAKKPWLDIWYMFFARTLIYLNSAMNPYLYNAMSQRFRLAVNRQLGHKLSRVISKAKANQSCSSRSQYRVAQFL